MNGENFHYQGKNFTIDWDKEKEAIIVIATGSHSERDAEDFIEKFHEILRKIPNNPLKILIDAVNLSKSDHEARRIYAKFVKEEKKDRETIVALCSANVFVRMVGKFIAISAGSTMKFNLFANAEDGLKWFKKNKNN